MKNHDWQRPAWQQSALLMMEHAEMDFPGSKGEQYMLTRGFRPGTLQAFNVGFRYTRDERPCVTLPWFASDGRVFSMAYRFVDGLEPRYGAKSGGYRTFFGLQNLKGRKDLMLVEGELNAMSVWQCGKDRFDVLSFGSESPSLDIIKAMRDLRKLYLHCYVWTDKETSLAEQLNAQQILTLGVDANDLLREGRLANRLA